MPGFVFSAGYYVVAAVTLRLLSNRSNNTNDDKIAEALDELTDDDKIIMQSEEEDDASSSMTTRGGWELGSYLFIGNGLQVIGLQTVPADRAAFLVQLTTVMVPLLSAFSEGTLSAVPLPTWFACIIAFAGVIIMGADDTTTTTGEISSNDSSSVGSISDGSEMIPIDVVDIGHSSTSSLFDLADMNHLSSSLLQISQGDILIVGAAVAYTMHVVRLGAYAPRTTPLKLAAAKASTEAFLSIVLVVGLTFIGIMSTTQNMNVPSTPDFISQTGSEVLDYFKTITSSITTTDVLSSSNEKESSSSIGVSIAAILWTGWVTCAYTIYAQSFGQKRVNPTDSNLIYTTQPLFSSAFAYLLLGETLGVFGYVGAGLIGVALALVSFGERDDS